MNKIPYKPPQFEENAFNCPFCNAFADQTWHSRLSDDNSRILSNTEICYCGHCRFYSIWHEEKMIYPDFSNVEPPNEDLNKEVLSDYLEAASILQKSPRGSAALLRLAIQKLCIELGEKGKDLNTDIGNLVKKGLSTKIQKALDSVRVIGNEAVHPGEIDIKDDIETANSLFQLVNYIAYEMLTKPKEIDAIYNKLPDSKKEQIKKRDEK